MYGLPTHKSRVICHSKWFDHVYASLPLSSKDSESNASYIYLIQIEDRIYDCQGDIWIFICLSL